MRLKSAISVATFAVFLAMIAVFVGYIASLGIRVSPPAESHELSRWMSPISIILLSIPMCCYAGCPLGR